MTTAERRYPPRADLLTLAGMLGAIGSLYLNWERHGIAQHVRMPIPSAYYSGMGRLPGYYNVIGLHTSAHWPVTIFALGCGSALLVKVSAANRSVLGLLQGACSLIVFVIALHWFEIADFVPLQGVIVAICAAFVLVYATIDRYAAAGEEEPAGKVQGEEGSGKRAG